MNELLEKFRAQYPQYGDMSDADLARALHGKFYSDMPFDDFAGRIGLTLEPTPRQAAETRLATGGGSPVTDFLHQAAEGASFGQADKLAGMAVRAGGSWGRMTPQREAAAREAEGQFQQRTEDLQELAPVASVAAGAAVPLGAGLGAAGGGLYRAIQAARAVPSAASAAGLVGSSGAPLMVPGTPLSALQALRTIASPALRGAARAGRAGARFGRKILPYGVGFEALRRLGQ